MNDLACNSIIALVEQGYYLFPVNNDKSPAGHWPTLASNDVKKIIRLQKNGYRAFGVAVMPSSVVVLDLDRKPGKPDGVAAFSKLCQQNCTRKHTSYTDVMECCWPDTYTVSTPGNGYHLYFTDHENQYGCGRGSLPAGIDVKGSGGDFGGYVLAPHSEVATGKYMPLFDLPVSGMPAWLTAKLQRPKRDPLVISTPKRWVGLREVLRSAEALLDTVADAPDGERNDILHWAACRMGELLLTGLIEPDIAEQWLLAAADRCGLTGDDGEYRCTATIRSGFRAVSA